MSDNITDTTIDNIDTENTENTDNAHSDQIVYLNSENIVFSTTGNGFLDAQAFGKDYKRVILSRALPFRAPDEYISVADSEHNEIGIIQNISDMGSQAELIRTELTRRYFTPQILRIEWAKEKMGYVYFALVTENGKKTIAVKDVSKNIRRIAETPSVLVFDVDGNRFIINDIMSFDRKSLSRLNPYLF